MLCHHALASLFQKLYITFIFFIQKMIMWENIIYNKQNDLFIVYLKVQLKKEHNYFLFGLSYNNFE
jgi:hypothetical protein